MTPDEVERQAETLALINSELACRLDRQADCLVKIDNKAVVVIGYALAAATFLATRHAQPGLAACAYGAFAVAAGFGITVVAVRNYQDFEPRALFTGYAPRSRAATLAVVAAMRVKHFEFNRGRLNTKAWQWWTSLTALLIGTMLMVAAILVQTNAHDHAARPRQPAVSVHPHRSSPGRAGSSPGRAGGSG
jgi:hypothetical protein